MSGNLTTSANDIVLGALLNINAFAPGQPVSDQVASTCMQILNDLLDSLSTDQTYVYTQTENIVSWNPGQYKYSVGNPTYPTPFSGFLTLGSPIITGVQVPSTLKVGASLTDLQTAIPAGTVVASFNGGMPPTNLTFTAPPTGSAGTMGSTWGGPTGLYLLIFSNGETRSATFTHASASLTWAPALLGTPTTSAQVNTNTITMSQVATQTLTAADTITYTTPGDLAFARPLRFRSGFTRVTSSAAAGLDYWFDIISFDRYNEIGLKTVSGPWPYLCAYQPTFPLGTLWIYPNPSTAGEVHLYTDLILSEFTDLTQLVNLPQGYNRSLKKLLALELCPIFGKQPSDQLLLQCKEARDLLKAQNASPVVTLRYDSDLIYSRTTDAGWILTGGFV